MCKENDISAVKQKMSVAFSLGVSKRHLSFQMWRSRPLYTECLSQREADKLLEKSIITPASCYAPFFPETTTPSTRRHTSPQSRRGQRPFVSAERVLRSRRFAAGQVRDAAPSAGRGTAGERSGPSLRPVSPLVLSGASRFRRVWLSRIASSQTWAARRPQIDYRHHGVRYFDPGAASVLVLERDWPIAAAAICDFRSSAKHRPPVEPSKKTQVNPAEAGRYRSPALAVAYEQLRRQVLGVAGSPLRGPGLAIFLERGMKAWIEDYGRWSERTADHQQATSAAIPRLPVPNEVVLLLTGLLLERTVQEER
jgi:hypothetical protein